MDRQTTSRRSVPKVVVLVTMMLVSSFSFSSGFIMPTSIVSSSSSLSSSSSYSKSTTLFVTPSKVNENHHHSELVNEMKRDIEEMRMEALQRLDKLNQQMVETQLEQQRYEYEQFKKQEEEKSQQQQQEQDSKKGISSTGTMNISSRPSTTTRNAQILSRELLSERDEELNAVDQLLERRFQREADQRLKEHQQQQREADKQKKKSLVQANQEEEPNLFADVTTATKVSSSSSTKDAKVSVVSTKPTLMGSKSKSSSSVSSSIRLLDDTRWRLMLNIGREQGTWMPKTWGVSGERLLMNMEIEFTSQHLYEREDFLNGVSGSKLLRIVHNEGTLAPTVREGGRKLRIKDGGWRVAPGEGPMGTNVLRFYFELEEETRHQGSDVYCPAGRVYCSCGYFPMSDGTTAMTKRTSKLSSSDSHDGFSINDAFSPDRGLKATLRQEQIELEARYSKLVAENDLDTNLVSWEKVQRAREMFQLRVEANKLLSKINEAHVREPERSLLRMSQDQRVGLTKEGGVCCKVQKGLAIEFHILGKFEIASMTNREHSDYRELLP